jgi:hypothetical protein
LQRDQLAVGEFGEMITSHSRLNNIRQFLGFNIVTRQSLVHITHAGYHVMTRHFVQEMMDKTKRKNKFKMADALLPHDDVVRLLTAGYQITPENSLLLFDPRYDWNEKEDYNLSKLGLPAINKSYDQPLGLIICRSVKFEQSYVNQFRDFALKGITVVRVFIGDLNMEELKEEDRETKEFELEVRRHTIDKAKFKGMKSGELAEVKLQISVLMNQTRLTDNCDEEAAIRV